MQISILTPLSVPTGEPTNLTAIASPDSEGQVLVAWLPPLPQLQNGVVVGYTLYLNQLTDYNSNIGKCSSNAFVSQNTTLTQYSFLQSHNYGYAIKVSAYTSAGSGPVSDCVYVEPLSASSSQSSSIVAGSVIGALFLIAVLFVLMIVLQRRKIKRQFDRLAKFVEASPAAVASGLLC